MKLDKMNTNEDLDRAYDRQLNRLIASKKRFDGGQIDDENFKKAIKRTLNNLADIAVKQQLLNDDLQKASKKALKFVRASLLNDIDNLLQHYVEQVSTEIEPDIGLFEVLNIISVIKLALALPLELNSNNRYPRD